MTRVDFHFNVSDKIDYACRLIRKIRRADQKAVVFCDDEARLRELDAALWNFAPLEFIPHVPDTDALVDWVTGDLMANGLASPGERVVIVFGAPLGVSGSTNSIRVHVIG